MTRYSKSNHAIVLLVLALIGCVVALASLAANDDDSAFWLLLGAS